MLRIIKYLLFSFILLHFAGNLLMLIPLFENIVRTHLEKSLSSQLDAPVKIGGFKGIYPFYIYIDEAEVKLDKSTVHLSKTSLFINPIPTMMGSVHLPRFYTTLTSEKQADYTLSGSLFHRKSHSHILFHLVDESKNIPSIDGKATLKKKKEAYSCQIEGHFSTYGFFLAKGAIDSTGYISHSFINFHGTAFKHPTLPLSTEGNWEIEAQLIGKITAPTLQFSLHAPYLKAQNFTLPSLTCDGLLNYNGTNWVGPCHLSAYYKGAPLHVSLELAEGTETGTHLGILTASWQDNTFHGEGDFFLEPLGFDGEIEAEIDDLQPFESLLGIPCSGECSIHSRFKLEQGKQKIQYHLEGSSLEIGAAEIDFVRVNGKYVDFRDGFDGDLSILAKGAHYGDIHWNEVSLSTPFSSETQMWPLSLSANGSWHSAMQVRFAGSWYASRQGFDLYVDNFSGVGGAYPFCVEEPVTLHADYHSILLTPLHLKVGKGDIWAHATTNASQVEGTFRADHLPLEFISLFVSPDVPFYGECNLKGSLDGSPQDVQARMKLHIADLSFHDKIFSALSPLSGHMETSLKKGIFTTHGTIISNAVQPFNWDITLPINLSLYPLQIAYDSQDKISGSLQAEGEITPFLEAYLNDSTTLTGTLSLETKLGGTFGDPRIITRANWRDGSYESLSSGAIFQNIEAKIRGKGALFDIESLTAQMGSQGQFSASGSILFSPELQSPFEFNINLENTQLLRLDYAQGTASGNLVFTGNSESGKIKGDLLLNRATLHIPEETPLPMQTVNVTFVHKDKKTSSPRNLKGWPVALDVHLDIPKDAHVTGRHLTTDWGGAINFSGTIDHPLLHGNLKLLSGEYLFNGCAFEGRNGTITFAGDPSKKTLLYVMGERENDDLKIKAILRGPLQDPELVFHSNPPLPRREILSHILFNRGTGDISDSQSSELTLSAGTDEKSVFSQIRSGIGIDRVDISNTDSGNNQEVSVRVGKYLSKGLFVSLNKGVNSEKRQVAVEAKVVKHIKIQGEIDDKSEGKLSLKWQHDY